MLSLKFFNSKSSSEHSLTRANYQLMKSVKGRTTLAVSDAIKIFNQQIFYRYKLYDIMNSKSAYGYFGGEELTLVNFKDLEADEVMAEKYTEGKKKWLLVSFKNKSGSSLGRLEKIFRFE